MSASGGSMSKPSIPGASSEVQRTEPHASRGDRESSTDLFPGLPRAPPSLRASPSLGDAEVGRIGVATGLHAPGTGGTAAAANPPEDIVVVLPKQFTRHGRLVLLPFLASNALLDPKQSKQGLHTIDQASTKRE